MLEAQHSWRLWVAHILFQRCFCNPSSFRLLSTLFVLLSSWSSLLISHLCRQYMLVVLFPSDHICLCFFPPCQIYATRS
ncbi:hypothetical protein BDV24DRAFT_137578 [Aspergillus arachidicola]|uniref:Uncharacterized protein n=1 Tax=Aspergillus arachidicola TaxID=656916 RepID=A0A5N6Y4V1_9EURO|nr:hypothetical protein BDV24DRAFT_137578 [Aspergillus arachidicola]